MYNNGISCIFSGKKVKRKKRKKGSYKVLVLDGKKSEKKINKIEGL